MWNKLVEIFKHVSIPWVPLGDFNEIVDLGEKFGGKPPKLRIMHLSKSCMDQCGFIEVGFVGPRFTWIKSNFGSSRYGLGVSILA